MPALFLLLMACTKPTPPALSGADVPPPPARSDVLYFVFLDRFANGSEDVEAVDGSDPQGWHGGDLQGLIDRLDYLEGLGIGGVWLSPITKARTDKIDEWGAFHGYWVEDLAEIEPRFGTMEHARTLSEELDRRGMSLWLDMVYNHVGYDTPLIAEQPDWFHHRGDILDWNDPVQVVTHDVHGLPDLAQENEEVYAHLRDASKVWLDAMDPDGFRVDAVRHLPEGFLARLGDEMRAARPGFEFLGEVFEGHAGALAARQRADRLDRVFDFPLHYAMKDVFCGQAHPGRIASTFSQDRAYGRDAALVTFLDNHDVSRIRSACDGDEEASTAAVAFLLASRGTPCLTYGTEVGLEGAEEPENRADMDFEGDPELRELVTDLIELRRTYPALRDGSTRVLALDETMLVVERVVETERVEVAVNLGGEPLQREGRWQVAASGLPWSEGVVPPRTVALRREQGAYQVPEERPVSVSLSASAPLEEGDVLMLVGAGDALGNWDPSKGIPVVNGRAEIPGFEADVVAFKMVIRRAGDWVWEDRADRYLQLSEGADVTVAW